MHLTHLMYLTLLLFGNAFIAALGNLRLSISTTFDLHAIFSISLALIFANAWFFRRISKNDKGSNKSALTAFMLGSTLTGLLLFIVASIFFARGPGVALQHALLRSHIQNFRLPSGTEISSITERVDCASGGCHACVEAELYSSEFGRNGAYFSELQEKNAIDKKYSLLAAGLERQVEESSYAVAPLAFVHKGKLRPALLILCEKSYVPF